MIVQPNSYQLLTLFKSPITSTVNIWNKILIKPGLIMCTALKSTWLEQPITQKECVPAFYNANFVCAEFDINMLGTQSILNICNHQHVKVYFFTSLNQVRTSLHARNKHSYINCYVLLRLAGTWYKTRNQQQEDINSMVYSKAKYIYITVHQLLK